MPVEIRMPALSPTMEEGRLRKWLIQEGAQVAQGDVIAEIETDKAALDFEAPMAGRVTQILVAAGEAQIKVDAPIALLATGDETTADDVLACREQPSAPSSDDTAAAPSGGFAATEERAHRVMASPAARRIARERGMELTGITGSGPGGRIVVADLIEGTETRGQSTPIPPTMPAPDSQVPAPAVKAPAVSSAGTTHIPLTAMRRSIATRMSTSRNEIPHIYLHRSLDATRLVALRSEINSVLAERGEHLTINDFILKACGLTLQQVPKARHIWADDHILDRGTCDVGVAIATRDSVVSPVVQDVDHKPITQISQEMRALRAQVDSGSPISSEAERSSLTLSNLGPHGVESFDAIITAPQSAVLAVGAIVQKPMVTSDGSVRSAPMMALTLGLDHRVLDGADGAAFLAHLVRLLEAPGALVI